MVQIGKCYPSFITLLMPREHHTTPTVGTDNAESVQIIIPAKQVKRKNDIYVCMVSSTHQVASSGRYIAIASTTVETANPIAELAPGIALIGDILER